MGYDFRIRGEIPGEKEAVRLARERTDAAYAAYRALDWKPGGVAGWHERYGALIETGMGYNEAMARANNAPDNVIAAAQTHDAAVKVSDAAEQSYFRLNITGMGIVGDIMAGLGMLKSTTGVPDWPVIDDEELYDHFKYESGGDDPHDDCEYTDDDAAVYRELSRKQDAVLSEHDPSVPGIEARKFGSNDGWIVTPEECKSVLKNWDSHTDEQRDLIVAEHPYFGRWMDYIRIAQHYGGFEVH